MKNQESNNTGTSANAKPAEDVYRQDAAVEGHQNSANGQQGYSKSLPQFTNAVDMDPHEFGWVASV